MLDTNYYCLVCGDKIFALKVVDEIFRPLLFEVFVQHKNYSEWLSSDDYSFLKDGNVVPMALVFLFTLTFYHNIIPTVTELLSKYGT